jgi:hypothetical protein
MKLRSHVRHNTGKTHHSIGTLVDGQLVTVGGFLPTAYVEIHEEEGGYFLIHHDKEGQQGADTWHLTLEEAKNQAAFEFEIRETHWVTVEE